MLALLGAHHFLHVSRIWVKSAALFSWNVLVACCFPFTFSDVLYKVNKNVPPYKSQQDAHVTEFILSDNCSACFGRHYHPSSGAQTTVTTASGNRYTVLLFAAIVEGSSQVQLCRSKEIFRNPIFLYIFHFCLRNERQYHRNISYQVKR